MAARGYWLAYQAVQESVRRVLQARESRSGRGRRSRDVVRELFAPSVTAGLLKPADLAGYRNGQVYIRKSMHVPLNCEAVRDAMPAFFDLLREETEPAVRVVLGHFVFVYIHPYMDGNGRIGRFLMNVMMAVGRISLDGHTRRRPQHLCRGARKGECRRGYCAVCGVPGRGWCVKAWPANRCRPCRKLLHESLETFVVSGF